MFEIGAVDSTAEARQRLVSLLHTWIQGEGNGQELIPQLSIRSISPDEIRFQSGLDLIVVGPDLLINDVARLGQLKRHTGNIPCVCVSEARSASLSVADQVARLGAEDIFRTDGSPSEFLQRILFLVRRSSKRSGGKIIVVESGKGGSGVTSLTAGIAEALIENGRTVCLFDWDLKSQDLSRFLLARPFLNEPLEMLLTGQRGVTIETVSECVRPVWKQEDGLFIVTPPSDSLRSGSALASSGKAFYACLEALRSKYDFVVVDAATEFPKGQKTIYGIASHVVCVASGDPAGFPAAGISLSNLTGNRSIEPQVHVVLNGVDTLGLGGQLGLRELGKLVPHENRTHRETAIPNCRNARQWPASGRTMYSCSRKVRAHLKTLAACMSEPAISTTNSAPSENPSTWTRYLANFIPHLLLGRKAPSQILEQPKKQRLLPGRTSADGQDLSELVSRPQFVE